MPFQCIKIEILNFNKSLSNQVYSGLTDYLSREVKYKFQAGHQLEEDETTAVLKEMKSLSKKGWWWLDDRIMLTQVLVQLEVLIWRVDHMPTEYSSLKVLGFLFLGVCGEKSWEEESGCLSEKLWNSIWLCFSEEKKEVKVEKTINLTFILKKRKESDGLYLRSNLGPVVWLLWASAV